MTENAFRSKMRVAAAALLVSCVAALAAGGSEWGTDFEEAKRLAAEKKRPILADFSGSDWCGWCIRLKREVFSQEAFKTFAKENLVLFQADFPRGKEQSPAVVAQNRELAKRYGIRGFPTVLLLEASGAVKARTGYRPGGAGAYVEYLEELVAPNANAAMAGDDS